MADEDERAPGAGRGEVAHGPWAGWYDWSARDPFERTAGPFYSRLIDDAPVCGMDVEARHLNGLGGVHGGALLSFADFALFALSHRARGGPGVTVSLTGDFLGPAVAGERLFARGEVTKAGGSLLFVRGLVAGEPERRPVLSFSGVIKRLRRPGG